MIHCRTIVIILWYDRMKNKQEDYSFKIQEKHTRKLEIILEQMRKIRFT